MKSEDSALSIQSRRWHRRGRGQSRCGRERDTAVHDMAKPIIGRPQEPGRRCGAAEILRIQGGKRIQKAILVLFRTSLLTLDRFFSSNGREQTSTRSFCQIAVHHIQAESELPSSDVSIGPGNARAIRRRGLRDIREEGPGGIRGSSGEVVFV